jgi:protein gp37
MSGTSAIAWTDLTWNPTTGCTRVTAGCDHCYAFRLHDLRHAVYQRTGGVYPNGKPMPKQYALPFSHVQLLPERLEQPLHIKTPRKIFVDSMSDLFHSQVPEEYLRRVFEVMCQAHWHSFQVLTKRPARLARLAPALPWPKNIWIGTSVELDRLTPRIDLLRQVPTPNRFLSLEPLLGPLPSLSLDGIGWVITGGESGPDARPCHPDWVRAIRDQCISQEVAFFHKQWGGRTAKAGGDELDGRRWREFPAGMVGTRKEPQ